MRVIPALAAAVAMLANVFRSGPKRTVIETPLKDALAPTRPMVAARSYFPQRRGRSKPGRGSSGFLRALQHIVMGAPTDPAARAQKRNERKRARRAVRP